MEKKKKKKKKKVHKSLQRAVIHGMQVAEIKVKQTLGYDSGNQTSQ